MAAQIQNIDRSPFCPPPRDDVQWDRDLGVFLPRPATLAEPFWYLRPGLIPGAIFCGAIVWASIFGIAAAVSGVFRRAR